MLQLQISFPVQELFGTWILEFGFEFESKSHILKMYSTAHLTFRKLVGEALFPFFFFFFLVLFFLLVDVLITFFLCYLAEAATREGSTEEDMRLTVQVGDSIRFKRLRFLFVFRLFYLKVGSSTLLTLS